MTTYFVTGATGFIGRHLVANLLKRKGHDLLPRAQGRWTSSSSCASLGTDEKRLVAKMGTWPSSDSASLRRR